MSLPALMTIGLFAEEILALWVGPDVAPYWPWLAIMLAVPASAVMLGPGQTALLVRADFLSLATKLLLLQAGRMDEAFEALERSLETRLEDRSVMLRDGELEPLRDDARWAEFTGQRDVEGMSVAEGWRAVGSDAFLR